MDPSAIASLLEPYVTGLTSAQLAQISAYLELLLRWNARMNLTAVRAPEHIVTRHFGESFFAARCLLPASRAIDVGSGAGFPGLAMKIHAPDLPLTLVESQNRKATFLKEVVRTLDLRDVQVFAGRAQDLTASAELVTLRAVERFRSVLPVAAGLADSGGRLALLISATQVKEARNVLPDLSWSTPVDIPGSERRVLLTALKPEASLTRK